MQVQLAPHIEKLILDQVDSGRYATPSEVLEAALKLLDQPERDAAELLTELREDIEKRLAGLDRGEGVDGEEVMPRLMGR